MPRHGENIYKRRDGRYEGRYVVGKTATGKTRFGYIYGCQYTEVRNKLLQKKAEQLKTENRAVRRCSVLLSDWLRRWLENEMLGSVKEPSYQTYLCQIKVHLIRWPTRLPHCWIKKSISAGSTMWRFVSPSMTTRAI